MALIRHISDLHLEFTPEYRLPVLDTDKDTILILNGDIDVGVDTVDFLIEMSRQFKYVVYVLGNHEYYGRQDLVTLRYYMSAAVYKKKAYNVYILENDVVELDGIKILGCTLWTDMDRDSPIVKENLRRMMMDYKQIKCGDRMLRPDDTIERHHKSVFFLLEHMDRDSVVVTHHAPSLLSCSPKYLSGRYGFASNLDQLIADRQPMFWLHGHTHHGVNYRIFDTRIISNQKGYPHEEGDNYDENFLIEIDNGGLK